MRWKLWLGVIGISLVTAGVVSSSRGAQADQDGPRSLRSCTSSRRKLPRSISISVRQGFGQGDQFVFTNDLLRAGTKVGEDGGSCTVTRLTARGANTWFCVASNALPGGQVTVEGLVTYGPDEAVKAEPYYFAITGGTGQYQGARGQVKIEEVSADEVHATFLIDV